MTNFSAVCVAEKLTTLTSTRPAALPASITARSEISGTAFRTHNPQRAVGRERRLQLLETRELDGFGDAVEDRIAAFHDAANRQMRNRALQLREKRFIVDADRRCAPVGFDANFLEPRRRILDLVGPLGRRRA